MENHDVAPIYRFLDKASEVMKSWDQWTESLTEEIHIEGPDPVVLALWCSDSTILTIVVDSQLYRYGHEI